MPWRHRAAPASSSEPPQPDAKRGMARLLSRTVLALFAVLLTLGALEVALRVGGVASPRASGRQAILVPAEHPDLAYVPKPGASGVVGRVPVTINSHGFRDREFTTAKPAGVRRIVALGDSITFGDGLPVEQTFPKQLEILLSGSQPHTEVLNLGVGGYDVIDEVAFLELVGLAFAPDVVVVGLCINDVGIHSANRRAVGWAGSLGWLVDHFRLARWLARRVERRVLTRDLHELNSDAEFRRGNEGRIDPLEDDPVQLARLAALERGLTAAGIPLAFAEWYTSRAKIGRLRHAFARLGRLSREAGFDVVVAILPYLDEAGHPELYESSYEIAAHEARRAGFRVLLLRDTLARSGLARLRQQRPTGPDPLHPNAEGHRLVAEALFAELGGASPRD